MSMLAFEEANLATWTQILNPCYLYFTRQTGLIGAEDGKWILVIDFVRLKVAPG